jgi:hypothetical protein
MISCSLNVEKQGLNYCSHHNCPDAKTDNKPDILVLCRHLHSDSFPSVYVLELTKLKKRAVYTPRSSTGELQYEESFSFHVIHRKYDLPELKQAILATHIWFNSVLPWSDRFEKNSKDTSFCISPNHDIAYTELILSITNSNLIYK